MARQQDDIPEAIQVYRQHRPGDRVHKVGLLFFP